MTILGRAVVAVVLATAWLTEVGGQDWKTAHLSAFDVAWETVRDSYHDPAFGGLDWARVRRDLRPRAEAAISEEEARQALRDMLARLGQSHFTLIAGALGDERLRGPATLPADVRMSSGRVLVSRIPDSRAAAGLRAGDELLAIDGVQLGAAAARGGIQGLDSLTGWRRVLARLSGPTDSVVTLNVRRADASIHDLEVRRQIEEGEPVTFGNLPAVRARFEAREVLARSGARVGVVAFNVWMPTLAEPIAQAIDRFRSLDGLVIDLSANGGGLVDMMRGVAGHVFDEPVLLGRMHTRTATLEFRANPRRVTTDGRRVVPFAGPVAIVVDGLTASASECFAAALQSQGRARVFGERTMGQALPALTRTLPSGDVLMYAVGDFATATGRQLEGVGVEPDERIVLAPKELAAGQDARWHAVEWAGRAARR